MLKGSPNRATKRAWPTKSLSLQFLHIQSPSFNSLPLPSHSFFSDRNGEKELIFVSLPTIGYLVSMVEFGKLLIARDHHQRLSITIIVLNFPLGTKAFTYIESIAIDASASDVRFLDLPGLRLHLINSLRNRTHFRY